MRIWTIGHSTRSWDDFVAVLKAHGIEAIADVRRFPGSRKHPQFGADAMARALPKAGIKYRHFPSLGGRRPARADSPNTAWRNASFRGYADYMASEEYRGAEQSLKDLAGKRRTAMLCAESVWWRCHRALISDNLKTQGYEVLHIADQAPPKEHPYTGAASVVNGKLSYGGPQPPLI